MMKSAPSCSIRQQLHASECISSLEVYRCSWVERQDCTMNMDMVLYTAILYCYPITALCCCPRCDAATVVCLHGAVDGVQVHLHHQTTARPCIHTAHHTTHSILTAATHTPLSSCFTILLSSSSSRLSLLSWYTLSNSLCSSFRCFISSSNCSCHGYNTHV